MRIGSLALALLALSSLGCGKTTSEQQLPFDRVSFGLYTATLVPGTAAGTYALSYPSSETQYVELEVLPDRGFYMFLIAGEMTMAVEDAPVVGSTLSIGELSFSVLHDPELPGGWMRGARLTSSGWVAACTEQTAQLTSWRWTSVNDLVLETADGTAQSSYRYVSDDSHGTLQGSPRGFFPPGATFVRQGEP